MKRFNKNIFFLPHASKIKVFSATISKGCNKGWVANLENATEFQGFLKNQFPIVDLKEKSNIPSISK